MSTPTINFTKASIEAINLPTHGRDMYRDAGRDYLYLFATPTRRVFYGVRKVNGRARMMKLGTFPEMTVSVARQKVNEWCVDLDNGRDPAQERRADRAIPTFGDLFARYIEDYAKVHKKTWQQDQWNYDRHVAAHWRVHRVDEITPSTVDRLHKRITETSGPVMANRILALVRGVFSWGITHEVVRGENPARATRANRERSRDRFMDADELQRFMAALESENPKMRDFFHLLLETGVRKSSLMRMAWVDVNMGKAVWRVAGEETKNGDPLTVPLTDEAVTILRRRFEENRQPRTIAGGKIGAPLRSTWVFPSREIDATDGGHLKDVARSWRAITKRAGLPDLHIHDIRRTLGSWMAAQGSSLLLIGKTLGHRDTKSTEVYARLDIDPVRKAVEQATQAMRNVAKGKQA